jgi:murein DD-endopeptidase MepM/ murein hydrolase activator NlpD
MDPFRIKRKWKITYQYGLDGVRKELQLSRSVLAVAVILLACVFVLSVLYLSGLQFGDGDSRSSELLKRENTELRDKLEYYSGVVDSIYHKLDTLKVIDKKPQSEEKLYPYNMNGADESLADNTFVYDSYLDARINSVEERLKIILTAVAVLDGEVAPESSLPYNPESGPSVYPTFGRWSDGWGVRMHPFHKRLYFHYGIDFANKVGTPVYATGDGEVIATAYDPEYGKLIKIRHANGFETRYGHLHRFEAAIGDQVRKGQIIAQMGNTGVSTGPHLHYEVLVNGAKVNPARYLNRLEEPVYYTTR